MSHLLMLVAEIVLLEGAERVGKAETAKEDGSAPRSCQPGSQAAVGCRGQLGGLEGYLLFFGSGHRHVSLDRQLGVGRHWGACPSRVSFVHDTDKTLLKLSESV
ncbi:hypothetical protein B0T25DRAFT_550130 [Lasiosphaeria hispida]|uniref:Secreted protein n=1 Tax=Lasiosphaeria hispida TaxID=260671 RepID=A0AAJ0HG62_9PEZI|nr:hypothetical protein B0T25DRAFT_550130 [Lasiosphaeria hispida]